MDDPSLVKMSLEGDKNAFERLVYKYKDPVWGIALSKVHNFDQAQDLAQDAFIEAYTKLRNLKDPKKFPNWLYGITKNLCNRWLGMRKNLLSLDDISWSGENRGGKVWGGIWFSSQPKTPEEHYEDQELREGVLKAISHLPEKSRDTITLFYIDGLNYKEISHFLGVSVDVVRSRLNYGRERLKGEMIKMVEQVLKEQRLPPDFVENLWRKQYNTLKDEIDSAISRVIQDCSFIGGEDVSQFEREVASYIGVKYGIGVASGTDALRLSLIALGVGEGDEVITSPFTFIATAETVASVGSKPVFVDIDPKTYCIDPGKVQAAITKKTKAIMPVHLFGQMADCGALCQIAKGYELQVVEDAAQAMGAEQRGAKACSWGTLGCLSFFPSENLGAYGDGGMILTNDRRLAERVRSLAQHGRGEAMYSHENLGTNSRLDSIQAAVLRVKLPYLNEWNERRRYNASLYDQLLRGSGVVAPLCAEGNTHVYNQYPIRLKDRDRVLEELNRVRVPAKAHYRIPLHLQKVFKHLGYKRGDFPVSEEVSDTILSLPIHPEMSEEEIRFIAGKVVDATKV